eukprot:13278.XXX_888401_888592_1 [CDS] Oithona nana genome sequencing.
MISRISLHLNNCKCHQYLSWSMQAFHSFETTRQLERLFGSNSLKIERAMCCNPGFWMIFSILK